MAARLLDLSAQPPAHRVGAKAWRLGWLMQHGWSVPPGVVAPFHVTDRLCGPGRAGTGPLREELAECLVPGRRYIVRSSANVEDLGGRAFAGQFTSIGDVSGAEDVFAAMQEVANSGRTGRVRAYARRVGVDPDAIRVAAIVQELVAPVAAGVAFSRDPVTGDERVIVEAVPGRGESLVGRGADPQRWVLAPGGGQQPVDPVLPGPVPGQIGHAVRRVAEQSGEPADIEWVWDGDRLHLVQWRPIARVDPPRVWSSRLARDMLPGLIPPLVWSVNVPLLSRVWVDLVTDALGDVGLEPDDLVRAFGYRAYFNTTAFGAVFRSLGMPPDALERMRAGTDRSAVMPPPSILVRRTPRLTRFAWHLATWERRATRERAHVDQVRGLHAGVDLAALPDTGLLAHVAQLQELLVRAARLNVVTPLLADHSAAVVRRMAQGCGVDPGLVDPGGQLPVVRSLDPAHALAGLDPDEARTWQEVMERFGHLSDSPNDCSRPTWSEQPDLIRDLVATTTRAVWARSSHVHPSPVTREEMLAVLPPARRPRGARRWDRAARLRAVREEVGYSYARVYALFRPVFLEAGRRLVERGTLTDPDDVFLLDLDEVRRALQGALPLAPELVQVRREEMAQAADLVFPETIVGDDPVPVRGRSAARALIGVPTSSGRHTGPARVVTSLASSGPIGPEDVLVLAAADVTWTPLLVCAGAVVTETGGMLAHAAIVARELGIPCVASVEGATSIPEGTLVSVDGAAGEVLLLASAGGGAGQGRTPEATP